MADDPYTYPGTDTLRNKLGITDDKTLTEAERRLTLARGAEAARLTFSPDAEGYRALHRHLFQDLYEWAGQDRTVNIAKGGSRFAAVPYIAREMDKLFADISAKNGFRGLPRDEFFDRLGNHINEMNAVHPSAKAMAARCVTMRRRSHAKPVTPSGSRRSTRPHGWRRRGMDS
ncbi:Fic/DOC family protein [Sphingomonas sp. NIC1]|uniref:Fic/DOC family protein n=1 Tax=Sphingomonas sp. NIC1 TaxID=1961362 RepID=UPI000A671A0B|nr:Fic family protein [Sphingomonas sp. NIC1]